MLNGSSGKNLMSGVEKIAAYPGRRETFIDDRSIALAFVGQVVANGETFEDPAFSRAGQMFQENLIVALKHAGIAPSVIISAYPVRAFPRSHSLCFFGKKETIAEGIPVWQVPFMNVTPLKEISIGIATVWSLIRWAARCRGMKRVVFTYNLTVPPGIFTFLGIWLIRAKGVVGIYDLNVPGETVPNTLWRRIDYRLHRWLLPRFDGHVAVTDSVMHDFAPGKRYLLLEGGISRRVLELTGSVPIKRSANSEFTILAVGRLDQTNGIPEIVKAFSLLAGDSYRLIIAGEGPLRKTVEEAAARDIRIQYRGYLKFQEVLDLYREASVLVCMRITRRLNTKYFFPSKTMESLASGVPVVSTCTGNLEKEYAGLLYLLHDETAEGLADLLRQIAQSDPEERSIMARKAVDFVTRCKTWNVQGMRVADYIRMQVLAS